MASTSPAPRELPGALFQALHLRHAGPPLTPDSQGSRYEVGSHGVARIAWSPEVQGFDVSTVGGLAIFVPAANVAWGKRLLSPVPRPAVALPPRPALSVVPGAKAQGKAKKRPKKARPRPARPAAPVRTLPAEPEDLLPGPSGPDPEWT